MLVRLTRIEGVDLRLFDFDYDLTWMAFFLNADETVYGRYGGRDAKSAEGRLSLAGLRYAMQAALKAHQGKPKSRPAARPRRPLLAEELPAAKPLLIRGGCIHCHQVYEYRRAQLKEAGRWDRKDRWVYPLPENVGLTLDVDQGNLVRAVVTGSPANKAGLRAGDFLQKLNGFPVASFADAQYALHKAPARGTIAVSWLRGGKERSGSLELKEGWRKTNLTWRPSMLELLPSLTVYGEDLNAGEKKGLGLSPAKLAFRQQQPVHSQARAAGVKAGDVIIGIGSLYPDMTMLQFLAHVRKNYLVGDRVTLHVIRDGKRVNLPMTLR